MDQVEVTKEEFFTVVGPLDVHPTLRNSTGYTPLRGYVSEWRLKSSDTLVGVSYGGTSLMRNRYFLLSGFLPAGASR